MTPPLACPVRGCGLLLERAGRRYACARDHSHDIARSGYVNLLQPPDRRSLAAGDPAEVVQARAALLAAGVGLAQQRAVAERAVSLLTGSDPVVVDLGSGTGDLLNAIASMRAVTTIGLDLSAAAAEHAARTRPDGCWVVANADRRLPVLDRSVDVVVSLHGRRNPVECHRILAADGHAIVAVPAADDLSELRAAVQGQAVARARDVELIAAHEPLFSLVDRATVRDRLVLDAATLRALLRTTYRGARTREAARAESLTTLEVTTASDLFVFARRRRHRDTETQREELNDQ
jgi:23S rRNA (guanine745-N1)-methyltransferase